MDNKQPAISVIVPIYNAEKHLHRCIDSILHQTFTDFEVLLINDGSTDTSGIICDEYAKKDSRVRAFHKENEGVSATRQFGLIVALGDYSIQIDSDDWIESVMFEVMYDKVYTEHADIVLCDISVDKVSSNLIKFKPSGNTGKDLFRDLLLARFPGSCVNKLVKHSLYVEYDIKYPSNINFGEDWYINVLCAYHAKNISYVPKPLYHYVQNSNSIMHNLSRKDYLNRFTTVDLIIRRLELDRYNEYVIHYILILKLECFYSKQFELDEILTNYSDYNDKLCLVNTLPLRHYLPIKFILSKNRLGLFMFSLLMSFRKILKM